jgi:hypothetical protein
MEHTPLLQVRPKLHFSPLLYHMHSTKGRLCASCMVHTLLYATHSLVWYTLSCMIHTLLYDTHSLVWCKLSCMIHTLLYDTHSLVWYTLSCMIHTLLCGTNSAIPNTCVYLLCSFRGSVQRADVRFPVGKARLETIGVLGGWTGLCLLYF